MENYYEVVGVNAFDMPIRWMGYAETIQEAIKKVERLFGPLFRMDVQEVN